MVRGTTPEAIEREFADARYGDFKAAVADAVVEYLAPGARALRRELRADEAELERILAAGRRARRGRSRPETLADVRAGHGRRTLRA